MTDNSHTQSNSPPTDKTLRLSQLRLLGLFAIAFVPIILATCMFFFGFGIPTSTANKGELILPPISITEMPAINHNQSMIQDEFTTNFLKPDELTSPGSASEIPLKASKWALLITGTGACSQQCEQALYTTRQVNIALGKEADRVQRLAVLEDFSNADQLTQYPLLKLYLAEAQAIRFFNTVRNENLKPQNATATDWSIWVVDPHGNVILHYDAERHGNDILKDMKRLLKLSNIG
ncbi:hypothetical protein OLMES_3241 [Oleiphilus messinensis]|uniref:Transmembrane protein n=1 Tax=Oleiphilus messinensis TaxID=141451 RepID=A0A1Y0I9T1_9GAMM|nr:hypothetical protein [Oleiphilus messinensis]ARU57282.1 hypothetical protein OLMES_3241 [Oleiphilus messinensis]